MSAPTQIKREHYVVGIEAARIAALRWKSEGRQIRVIVPSRPGTDFNDLIMEASL
jgi:hypothetical protein